MNSKNDHPVDAFARNILADAQVEPREELWSAISAGVAPPAKRRGGILPWLWVPAAAAVIGLLMLFTLEPKTTETAIDTAGITAEKSRPVTPPTSEIDQQNTNESLAVTPETEPESAPKTYIGNGNRENVHPGKDRIAKSSATPIIFPKENKGEIEIKSTSNSVIQEITPALSNNNPQQNTPDPAPNEDPKTSNPFIREQMLQTPVTPLIRDDEQVALNEWNERNRDDQNRRGTGKWKLGGLIAPEYAFASGNPAVPVDYPASGAAPVNENGASLTPTTAFSTGLKAEYALSERVGLQSGLLYTMRQGQAGSLNSLNFVQNSPVSADGALFYQTQYSFHFMEVPVALKYNLLMRPKWNFFVSSGLSGNFFMSYKSTEESVDLGINNTETVTNPFRPSQLDILVGTGLEFALSRKLFLNLEPGLSVAAVTSRYSFAASRPISLTFNTGLNFGL